MVLRTPSVETARSSAQGKRMVAKIVHHNQAFPYEDLPSFPELADVDHVSHAAAAPGHGSVCGWPFCGQKRFVRLPPMQSLGMSATPAR